MTHEFHEGINDEDSRLLSDFMNKVVEEAQAKFPHLRPAIIGHWAAIAGFCHAKKASDEEHTYLWELTEAFKGWDDEPQEAPSKSILLFPQQIKNIEDVDDPDELYQQMKLKYVLFFNELATGSYQYTQEELDYVRQFTEDLNKQLAEFGYLPLPTNF